MNPLAGALVFLASIALNDSALAQDKSIDVMRCANGGSWDPKAAIVLNPVRTKQDGDVPATRARLNVFLTVPAQVLEEVLRERKIELTDEHGRPWSFRPIAGKRGQYTADVDVGTYELRASAELKKEHPELWNTPPLKIVLEHGVYEVTVHLANEKANAEYYRMGKGLVPFKPSNTVVVAFNLGAIPPDDLVKELKRLATELEVKDAGVSKAGGTNYAMLRFTLPRGVDPIAALDKFRAVAGRWARVGIAIDQQGGSVEVMDSRYVLRLNATVVKDTALRDRALEAAGLVKIKGYPDTPDLMIVEFKSSDYRKNLATLNCLVEIGVAVTAEPDLIGTFRPLAMPGTWPNDKRYGQQKKGNHKYQQVRDAWKLLYDDAQKKLVGKDTIYVGLIDDAIDPEDEDVACSVDGLPKISLCWDPHRIVGVPTDEKGRCVAGNAQQSHGMAMLGVMAACANDKKQVAGIAPNARINAVRFDMLSDYAHYARSTYADLLLWIGGREVECSNPASPAPEDICNYPRITSHIVNNSYEIGVPDQWDGSKIELPLLVDAAFEALATKGRGGKGTILVYAAGQATPDGAVIEIREPLAADSRVIAVSNCWMPPPPGHERLYRGERLTAHSNYGDNITVCADGERSETVRSYCKVAPGHRCDVGGTSAAAATVSGVVALMLSANPDLTAQQVKDILRATADRIDMTQDELAIGNYDGGHSKFYGGGRVNAYKAVQAALSAAPAPH